MWYDITHESNTRQIFSCPIPRCPGILQMHDTNHMRGFSDFPKRICWIYRLLEPLRTPNGELWSQWADFNFSQTKTQKHFPASFLYFMFLPSVCLGVCVRAPIIASDLQRRRKTTRHRNVSFLPACSVKGSYWVLLSIVIQNLFSFFHKFFCCCCWCFFYLFFFFCINMLLLAGTLWI